MDLQSNGMMQRLARVLAVLGVCWCVALSCTTVAFAQPPEMPFYEEVVNSVAKIRADKLSPQQAWDAGLISERLLLLLLSEQVLRDNDNEVLDSVRNLWSDPGESQKLAQILVEYFPEKIRQPKLLERKTRLKVAQYWVNQRDPRGALLLEQMLEELPRDTADTRLVHSIIYLLSGYHRANKDQDKMMESVQRVRQFTFAQNNPSVVLLMSGRAAQSIGDINAARGFYLQVIELNIDAASEEAYHNLAEMLFDDGKTLEGREVLKQAIEAVKSETRRIQFSHRLARSYFAAGEWEDARKYAQITVEKFQALATPDKDHEWILTSAKRMPDEIERWKERPVTLTPDRIFVNKPENDQEKIYTWFRIRSYRNLTPKMTSSNPGVQAWIMRSPVGLETSDSFLMGVAIAPGAIKKDVATEISIALKEFPELTLRVPIRLIEPEPLFVVQ